ncbi:MAG TPA: adenylate/guanylate cyclase domain-containing protein [Bacteroidales bacterium]|nr:adenylate/guanylate cyclase domain-containing protein [Bacteroidales bacterium]
MPFYVYPVEKVSFEVPAFTTTIYRFNLGGSQCYTVQSNPNNIIYVSNDGGILVFNGSYWNLIPLPEKCFDVYAESQQLYFVCETFIGIINKDESLNPVFKKITLPQKITSKHKAKLFKSGNELYLFTNPSLYMASGNKLNLISSDCSDLCSFQNNIYILDSQNSLYKLNGRQTEFITAFGNNRNIYGFVRSKNNIWVKTNKREMIAVDPSVKTSRIFPIKPAYQGAIHEINIAGNTFLRIDSSQHIVIYTPGKAMEKDIRFSNPLTETAKYTYCDSEGNIWLLNNEGIVRLSMPSYANVFPQLTGVNKGDWTIFLDKFLIYNNQSQALVFSQDTLHRTFRLPTSSTKIISAGNRLIGFDTNSVSDISLQGNVQLIEKGKITLLTPSQLNYAGFYCVVNGQLKLFYYVDNTWRQRMIAKTIPEQLVSIIECNAQKLLALSSSGKLYKMDGVNGFMPLELKVPGKKPTNLPWLNISRCNENIFLQNFKKVYQYKYNDSCTEVRSIQKLVKHNSFIQRFIPLGQNAAAIVLNPIGETSQEVYYFKDIFTTTPDQAIKIPYQQFDPGNIEKIMAADKNTLILSGRDKTIQFNLPNFLNERRANQVFITKILSLRDTILYENRMGLGFPHREITLDPQTSYIRFEFTSPGYKSNNDIKYAYFLEGYDLDWSEWQNIQSKTYLRLASGKYSFRIKAMQNNGQVSDETIVTIHIKAPFYLGTTAYIVYGLIVVIVIIIILIKRKRKFEWEKSKLERIISERTAELQREKEVTEELLANLLPKDTVTQLKSKGKAISQKYDLVTVLFSDIEGFTKIAEQMNPEQLIDDLDNFFFHFDSVVEKYNIEKIKTIGDAYMCAGGIPYKNRTNPVEVVLAAIEMQDYMRQLKQKDINIWDLRIGIHTGAVIAGVVGHKKLSYDIWGDTVNTASRMESSGEAGKINISGHTYELVKDFFVCEYRGRMPVKYKGDVDMYFVKGIRPELSVDLKVIPNKKFFIQLQLLRLQDLEEFVLDRFNVEFPNHLYFHNAKRAKDVHTQTELIARAEEISPEEMLLVRTAALLVDTGIISNYYNHLVESVKFAREILPKFRYSTDQIDIVCRLIISIDYITENTGKLEAIVSDAYLNYYGRVDYMENTLNLLKEVKMKNTGLDEKKWWDVQLEKMRNFRFKTPTGQLLREVSAEKQLQKLKEYLNLF